jgi:hypothetical protein
MDREIESTVYPEVPAPKFLGWLPNVVLDCLLPSELELNVSIEFDYEVENDSIGWMEIWGSKQYDHQPDYVTVGNVNSFDYDKKDLPASVRLFLFLGLLELSELEGEIELHCQKEIENGDWEEDCMELECDRANDCD